MSFLISDAYAQGQGAPSGAGLVEFLPIVVIFVVFYFLLIRPQQKRAGEQKKMIAALEKGDEVITNGGLLGRITKVTDSFLKVEIADGIEVRVQRAAVSSLVPKGTLKSS